MARVTQDVESIPAGQSYLDVGCGRGEMVHLARRRGVDAKGVELVEYLCDGETIVNGQITALPFGDDAFDIVSCYDVIEHLPPEEVDTALDELFRVAKSIVILTTNDKRSHYEGMELHLTRRPRQWWDEQLKRRAGTIERDTYGANEWHWRCAVGAQ